MSTPKGSDSDRIDGGRLVLLTGATGYVGGRLLTKLEQRGVRLRCLARNPANLTARAAPTTEVVQGDLLDSESLDDALRGVHAAYYLVHSMGSDGDFAEQDKAAAENFARTAKKVGVDRIIYLGGLGDDSEELSPHLRSRHEVGRQLFESGATVVELRASIVIGSGSLSFELVRALVERLPVMICPRWVGVLTQPIAVEDLLEYLLAAVDLPADDSRVLEIGGPDQVSYGQIMEEYARQRGLRRWLISVPVLTPRLSSLWLGLVTPVYARVGRILIDSVQNPTVIQDPTGRKAFSIQPRGLTEAIKRALVAEDNEFAETRWSDALSASRGSRTWGGIRFKNRIVDSRTVETHAHPSAAFEPIKTIGGRRGWYYANSLWKLRAWIDLLVGGVGIRRGRRDPQDLRVGDVLDWWRVEEYDPAGRLRLLAEMKVPGRAWLEFEVTPSQHGSTIRQTAIFDPVGIAGLAYWYALYPLHALIFSGMLKRIVSEAEATKRR
ncbi:3 beta-hydroxysteroid dehydrogenase/Delta 5--_4-isomerase [Posidoniimonas corsicana]|uniref:3 beta-hydroxysteroid dehydrogenase/Delta 5-->4-isomerase n=1 Tax=Posidoniimonas corsicana TaxID=1938618 RepID=A0A5C5VF47_9BACT|nr:SDR family oxidoreductase [Posidoniimonas corsicana]TWT36567.1 3 beta-hydroxysteroid dehydrogenase/Delta 5-->4-isomerase [Posidoniimonas corsicana]